MNKNAIVLISIALMMSGCTKIRPSVVPEKVETTAIDVPQMNLHTLALEILDSMISSTDLMAIIQNTQPIVFVRALKNKTTEYIDTASINEMINLRLLDSGIFTFVDIDRLSAVRKELNLQEDHALVNPGTAIEFGKMLGARYMLTSDLVRFVKQAAGGGEAYYKMTMRLIDLETGIIEWTDDAQMRDLQSQDYF